MKYLVVAFLKTDQSTTNSICFPHFLQSNSLLIQKLINTKTMHVAPLTPLLNQDRFLYRFLFYHMSE